MNKKISKVVKRSVKLQVVRAKPNSAAIRRITLANKFPFEKLKPGRYGQYYSRGGVPIFFRSINGEKEIGTPGAFLNALKNATGKTLKAPNPNVPQIALVSPKELSSIFNYYLNPVSTIAKRKELESIPHMKRILVPLIQEVLAGIDWLEATHKIRVEVDPQILKWIIEK